MIGKSEWFQRRKYSGWGFTPKTWQGFAYIGLLIAALLLIQFLPINNDAKLIGMIGLGVVFSLDFIDIMIRLKKDERERMHEAIAERNVAWFMVIVIAIGLAYQSSQSVILQKSAVDPFLIIALVGGLLVKIVSNLMLERKG